jgi:hypothetical protein
MFFKKKKFEVEELDVKFKGDFNDNNLSKNLKTAFMNSLNKETNIPDWILGMRGMSGRKYRRFINNFFSINYDNRYLEVGSYTGSTACSAIANNKIRILCIDNWSQFGDVRSIFFKNIEKLKNKAVDFNFIEKDFKTIDESTLGFFNVYLFDGPHEENDHYLSLKKFISALDNYFLFIVDDWNNLNVRNGTLKSLKELKINIISEIQIFTSSKNIHPKLHSENSDWHDGYLLAVCKKDTN